ncbi:hypothetical protein COI76_14360 [Bacillus cereus]|uniref:polysaccharide deacetylase family protein n=1 Tax=Bacillus sp. AW TaxID=2293329 RepID=UPI000BF34FE3|nr:hypothetical protein COI76_14360 [Bacillus cereus]RFB74448.1 hypothetical protein DZB94_13595 [Bacillus sp. AW]
MTNTPISLNRWGNTAQDREFRNKTNENWDKIEKSYTGIQEASNTASVDAEIAREQADKAKEKADAANQKSQNVQEQLNTIVVNGDSSVEAAQARVEKDGTVHTTLKGHTDAIHDKIGDIHEYTDNVKTKSVDISGYGKKSKVLCSFVSDDGQQTDYTILKPIFESEGVPCCMAIPTGPVTHLPYFDHFLTNEQVLELQNELGWEVCGHTVNHYSLQTLSEPEVEYQLYDSKKELERRGYKVNNLMYPHGTNNAMVRRVARKYYRSAFGYSHGAVDTPPFDTYKINRVGLGAWFDVTVDDPAKYPEGTRNTFETYYKPRVDEALAKGGWIVFGLHSAAPQFDAIQQEYLKQTIQYVKSKGIKIVTINQGLDLIGNVVDVEGNNKDDTKTKYLRVGSDGSFAASDVILRTVVLPKNTISAGASITAYEKGRITHCFVDGTYATGTPGNRKGLIITDYSTGYEDFVFQTFLLDTGERFIRYYVYKNQVWDAWKLVATGEILVKRLNDNEVITVDGIEKYQKKTITYCTLTGSNVGPDGKNGLLVTDYTTGYEDMAFQTFYSKDGGRYIRYYNVATKVWRAFEEIAIIGKTKRWYRINLQLQPNSSTNINISGFTVKDTDVVFGSPYSGLPHGISFYTYVNGAEGADNVFVYMMNHTNAAVTVNKEFNFKVL